jgi:HPt (histidine-containing phosphotransfer) domain-containing protein
LKTASIHAHTLKGTFANISSYKLKQTALEIEAAAKQNEARKAEQLLNRLEQEYEQLKKILERHLKGKSPLDSNAVDLGVYSK